jgi:hypothetical protein
MDKILAQSSSKNFIAALSTRCSKPILMLTADFGHLSNDQPDLTPRLVNSPG